MTLQAASAAFFLHDVGKGLLQGHAVAGPVNPSAKTLATLSLMDTMAAECPVL